MSTLDKIKNVVAGSTPSGPSPDQLRFKLAEQEEKLTGLKRVAEDAAFDLSSGVAGSEQVYAEANANVTAAEELLESLKRAIPAAERRVQADRAKALQAVHASQIAATGQHLAAREKAALDLQNAITRAIIAWKAVVHLSLAAKNAAPATPTYPLTAGITGAGHVNQLIQAELFRQAADPEVLAQPNIFPGAKVSVHYVNQPQKIPPLIDAIKEANAYVMSTIRGERQIEQALGVDEQIFPADMIRSGTLPSTAEQPAIAGEGEPKYVAGSPDEPSFMS